VLTVGSLLQLENAASETAVAHAKVIKRFIVRA
jgi:hypothetical protein